MEQQQFLASLTIAEKAAKLYDWTGFLARDDQLPPDALADGSAWVYWLILAGRGYGKTRTGAETVRQWVKDGFNYVNFIGATVDDVRSIMVEGESGILAICPDHERPRYIANQRKLVWPNGAVSLLFSAEEPERFRGKQHMKLWADEIAAWRRPEAWDQANFGLRLGRQPQAVITTTPRPTKLMRSLMDDSKTIITRGSTYDNKDNLAETFIHAVVKKYEGTRLGRQELNAEMLGDTPGALWTRDLIDETRVSGSKRFELIEKMTRIVVAVDPPVTSGEKADECGIVVVGLDKDGDAYVFDDVSAQGMTPNEWAKLIVDTYHRYSASYVVAEVNNGGELIESVLRQHDANLPFRAVRASRGKVTRAEPISTFYERRKAHHVGSFPQLEDQMCEFTNDFDPKTAGYSPDRVDALVWAMTDLIEPQAAGMALFEVERRAALERAGKVTDEDTGPDYAPGSVEYAKAQLGL